jgi:hypothetical protein
VGIDIPQTAKTPMEKLQYLENEIRRYAIEGDRLDNVLREMNSRIQEQQLLAQQLQLVCEQL